MVGKKIALVAIIAHTKTSTLDVVTVSVVLHNIWVCESKILSDIFLRNEVFLP